MFQFSILIPSWNNLAYLQLCISSILKNSKFKNQIIVYVNDGSDGTLEWIRQQSNIDFIHSSKNEGICVAMNACRSLVKSKYMVYLNDDMYVCPDWDLELQNEIDKIGHDQFMLSSTLIEPFPTTNPNMVSIVQNFGTSPETFKEKELLDSFKIPVKGDWSGSSWPPSVVSIRMWDIVGGYSIEFSPGMYSDPDFSMKLWKYGVRIFKGIGASRVYHFQSKSTNKVKKNKGGDTFLLKWGITAKTFYRNYLRMGEEYGKPAKDISNATLLKGKIKRSYKAFFS
jgi:glycosyltransferase involved in cell wall biosynthesis